MTIDAGLQAIVAGYTPAGPAAEGSADLTVSVGQLAAEMVLERKRRALFEQKMQYAIRDVPLLSVDLPAGTPATFASPDWVCKTGFEWFAQLFTAKGLGSTDTLWIYRTSASGGLQVGDSAARWLLTNAAPAWAPGRTGFAMKPGDGIVLQGTTTAAVTVNIDVIMVEQWLVPDFLL
jgi:hypothetical protein